MSEIIEKALALPNAQRYFLAMRLLASLEEDLISEGKLSESQIKELYEAKENIEKGQADLISKEMLKARISEIRESKKKAS